MVEPGDGGLQLPVEHDPVGDDDDLARLHAATVHVLTAWTDRLRAEVGDGQHPLVLANQEGFVIRSVAVPATGTWQVAVTVDWTEVDAY